MTLKPIEHEIQIEAPVDVVWRTITEPDQICRWFSQEAELEARPGALGSLTFRPDDQSESHVATFTVVTVEPPHTFSYRWVYPEGETARPENSVLVTFTLTAKGEALTTLRVVETGLELLDWPDGQKQMYVEDHLKGWQKHIGTLGMLFVTAGEPSS